MPSLFPASSLICIRLICNDLIREISNKYYPSYHTLSPISSNVFANFKFKKGIERDLRRIVITVDFLMWDTLIRSTEIKVVEEKYQFIFSRLAKKWFFQLLTKVLGFRSVCNWKMVNFIRNFQFMPASYLAKTIMLI